MIYQGGCHCGEVAFEVEGELTGAMACNCSICSRKGSFLWFVARDKLRLLTSEECLGTYTFNKHVIKHHFCLTCGIHPFGEGVDTKAIEWLRSIFAVSKILTSHPFRSKTSTAASCECRAALA